MQKINIIGVSGISGAGKSTLVKALSTRLKNVQAFHKGVALWLLLATENA